MLVGNQAKMGNRTGAWQAEHCLGSAASMDTMTAAKIQKRTFTEETVKK